MFASISSPLPSTFSLIDDPWQYLCQLSSRVAQVYVHGQGGSIIFCGGLSQHGQFSRIESEEGYFEL
jgi:hypothetical protein